jgi:uncharacterized protein
MIVVSNTSPILNLATINQLDVLHQLYDTILIPPAVYDEIVVAGAGKPGSRQVRAATWIHVHPIINSASVSQLQDHLDSGESEAIVLADEQQADLLLIDEYKGRKIAAQYGVVYTGLLGLLVVAKHHNVVPAVKPLMDDLVQIAGFWISRQLYQRILHEVGE